MNRPVRWLARLFLVTLGVSVGLAFASAAAAGFARKRIVSSGNEDSDEFEAVAIFDGFRLASRAKGLRRARLIAWFGGADIDLRAATLDPAGAVIEARAAWGGANVRVPAGWRVETKGFGIFGGVTSNAPTDGLPADAPHLQVHGLAIFGGVSVQAAK